MNKNFKTKSGISAFFLRSFCFFLCSLFFLLASFSLQSLFPSSRSPTKLTWTSGRSWTRPHRAQHLLLFSPSHGESAAAPWPLPAASLAATCALWLLWSQHPSRRGQLAAKSPGLQNRALCVVSCGVGAQKKKKQPTIQQKAPTQQ